MCKIVTINAYFCSVGARFSAQLPSNFPNAVFVVNFDLPGSGWSVLCAAIEAGHENGRHL